MTGSSAIGAEGSAETQELAACPAAEPLPREPDAEVAAPDRPIAGSGTLVTFLLGDQVFAVPVEQVREILDRVSTSFLPNAAPDCTGVIDTRGESIPLIDLVGRLGMPPTEEGPDTRIIIFEISVNGARRPIGVLASQVLNVTEIAPDQIEQAPAAAVIGGTARGLQGLARIAGKLVVLLDMDALFAEPVSPIA